MKFDKPPPQSRLIADRARKTIAQSTSSKRIAKSRRAEVGLGVRESVFFGGEVKNGVLSAGGRIAYMDSGVESD